MRMELGIYSHKVYVCTCWSCLGMLKTVAVSGQPIEFY